jgi:hypothetical protein
MKTATRWVLRIVAGIVLLGIGFFIGGIYAGRVASDGSHLSAISYFTAIDAALDGQDAQKARRLAERAIDLHVAAMRALEERPRDAWIYAAPWMSACYEPSKNALFAHTWKYFDAHPEQLQPQTREFLARHAALNRNP